MYGPTQVAAKYSHSEYITNTERDAHKLHVLHNDVQPYSVSSAALPCALSHLCDMRRSVGWWSCCIGLFVQAACDKRVRWRMVLLRKVLWVAAVAIFAVLARRERWSGHAKGHKKRALSSATRRTELHLDSQLSLHAGCILYVGESMSNGRSTRVRASVLAKQPGGRGYNLHSKCSKLHSATAYASSALPALSR